MLPPRRASLPNPARSASPARAERPLARARARPHQLQSLLP